MGLTGLAVRRWQLTLVLSLLMSMLAVLGFVSIPRSADPHFPIPVVIVTVVLPGADAAEMEERIAKPIEDAVQGLDDIRHIASTSVAGSSVIIIDFLHGTDDERALDRVQREVSAVRDALPQGIARIDFRRPRTSEAAVLQLALVSDTASWRRMVRYARDLKSDLSVVPGVRSVSIDGAPQPEARVAISAGKLAESRLPASSVAEAITRGGEEMAVGAVHSADQRYDVDAGGAYRSLAALGDVVVRANGGRMVRVSDVANVGWAESEQLHVARFDDHRALFVTIRQKDDADAGTLHDALIRHVERISTELPPDMRLAVAFDQGIDIDRKLGQLGRDFAIALGLVLVTLIPLGPRPAAVVMFSIPLSLSMGVLVLLLLGYSLNQVSIAGFIISLGLLVDDSVVVVENIERRLRAGGSAIESAIAGTREISAAIVGATVVLLVAFVPLAVLPDAAGDFVRPLPMAVIATVASSLLVSLTVIPFLASRVLRTHGKGENRALAALMGGIRQFYTPMLRRALDRPWLWLSGALVMCLAAFALVPIVGFSLFPAADTSFFLVRIERPQGSSIPSTDRAVRDISALLRHEPYVVNRMENAGHGNPQVFYNVLPREENARYGEILATTRSWNPEESANLFVRLRHAFERYPDARVTLETFQNGPPISAPIEVRISGPNLDQLKLLSDLVVRKLERVPGMRDVESPISLDRAEMDLGLDERKSSLLGIAPGEARRTLKLAIAGEVVSRMRDDEGDSWPVTVRLPMATNQPISAFSDIYVPTLAGESVPLLSIAHPGLKSVPEQISRYKLQRSVTVTGYNQPGVLTSRLNAQVRAAMDDIHLPTGYHFDIGGEAEISTRSFAGIGSIILLAAFGLVGVLLFEFGRFRETLVVIGVIPLGTFGGLVALFLTGNSLSFLAVIGFVALIGIEIKNSILLVDFASRLTAEGVGPRQAIEQAGEVRFLPVLLTSVTAIGGLLPLALGESPLYSPLAWVMIGGLLSSTLLSRVITPVMYLLALRARRRPLVAD